MTSPAEPPSASHAPDGDPADSGARPTRVDGHALGSHRLGPHVVGQRVVVRRIVPGETGPTGGPAFTDTLGECVSWGRGLCEVRTETGVVVNIHIADIVSGKPVPARASVRLRVPAREVHLKAGGLLTGTETVALGEWVLRHGGTTPEGRTARRGNSALAVGDPGLPLDEAAEAVTAHYDALDLEPLALVVTNSPEEAALLDLGWSDAGGRADAWVAPLSRVRRLLPAPPEVAETEEVSATLAVSTIGEGARVQVALDESHTDIWAALGDLWVIPAQRRTGLARAVLAEAADWAGSRGATTLHLQVETTNVAATQLYRSLGFSVHHRYRYLRHSHTTVSDGV